jgi:hypothetical protein
MRAPGWGWRSAVALLSLVTACAEEQPRQAKTGASSKGGDAVIIDAPQFSGLPAGKQVAWLAYGIAKLAVYKQHPPPETNTSADDFEIELEARRSQTEVWGRARADAATPADVDLDRQLEISKAGMLPELVVAIQSSPGWTVPRDALLKLRLEAFAQKFPGDFSLARPTNYVPPGGTLRPPVPGGDFPDPTTLPFGIASCDLAREDREAAWRRWSELEPRLGGMPVSAASPLDFARQLIALQRRPSLVARGATWVSGRVGYLAQLEGFCAVEQKDWARAEGMLRRAVALLPAEANPRLELSLVLVKAGRTEAALKEADEVLATTHDGCAAARAWRRRGYILIDLGDLAAAREAYEKSLVIDPGNRLALSELTVISNASASPKAGVVVPSPPAVVVTACRPADLPAKGEDTP